MEVFSLMAKLTLDTEEYERSLHQAEADAHNMDDPESPSLGLDKSEFDSKIAEAEEVDVDDPDSPELDLDKQPFDDKVTAAENTDVADPDSPELDLETEPYKGSLEQAQADTETWSATIGDIFEGLKGVLVAAGITAVVSGIVTDLSEAVDLARSVGDNIDKQSRAMSISTDAYQEWSHVLDINGASITDLNRGLMNMRKLMGGGDAPEEFSKAMVKLGLATEDAEGNISSQFSSTEEMLKSAMKALADFDTSTQDKLAQRDYLAQAIFGRGGTKLNAMFDGTSEDIDALIQQAHELGLVMNEESVANAAAYNDSVTNMRQSIEAFKMSLVESFLPTLTNINNTISNIVSMFNLRNNTEDATLEDVFDEIDTKAVKAAEDTERSVATAKDLIKQLGELGDYWTLDEQGQTTWDTLVAKALDLFPQLSDYIDKDGKKINANTKEIEKNIDAWARLQKERILSSAMDEKRMTVAKQIQEAYEKGAEARVKASEGRSYEDRLLEIANAQLQYSDEQRLGLGQMNFKQYWQKYMGYEAPELFDASNFEEYYKFSKSMSEMGANVYEYKDAEGVLHQATEVKNEMNEISNAYTPIHEEAEKLRTEADSLLEAAEEAKSKLDEYEQYLVEEMGLAGGEAEGAKKEVDDLNKSLGKLPTHKQIQIDLLVSELTGIDLPPKAKGDWNVPYDMPVYVHRGERILTASQARQGESSGLGTREIVSAISGLRNDLQQLQLVVGTKTFGRAVVDYGGNRVDNYIGEADNRQASGYGT